MLRLRLLLCDLADSVTVHAEKHAMHALQRPAKHVSKSKPLMVLFLAVGSLGKSLCTRVICTACTPDIATSPVLEHHSAFQGVNESTLQVRGAVFSMLGSMGGTQPMLPGGTRWLDLYAGTGRMLLSHPLPHPLFPHPVWLPTTYLDFARLLMFDLVQKLASA